MTDKCKFIFTDKRKLNAEGEYDPSSPTSENNDETPAKKVALSTEVDPGDSKQETKPASPKKKTLPELEKYWKAVNEDPSDFTGWTYLLQYVDQEVSKEYSKNYTEYMICFSRRMMLKLHVKLIRNFWSVIHIAMVTGENLQITRRRRGTPKMSKG